MSWSITDVARMSGVTSRTLRHYDAVGLVHPAYVAGNGYRWYEREQLLRLQRVLLMRELGLGLPAIADVLAGDVDQASALREHREQLVADARRLETLIGTVSRTIEQLEGSWTMTAEEMFEGFEERRAELEERLVARHGEGVRTHFETSRERTRDWSKDDYLEAARQGELLEERIAAVMRSGAAADSDEAMTVVAEHHQGLRQFWEPDRASYLGLAQTYVEEAEHRQRYEARQPGLAAWLRDAMTAYAQTRMN